ncbi:uncharacterized protein STEHIDRAFT_145507 [Stereum hirsutum FP-91666 SS1]|uniref:uncharacterized protein n=1 Tax=Stereum hirsutum (strain FP-91666) TaxID=721885 RepID=UPI000440B257|nr:uncharacterized protein STEHIDRAFT_145507 [Stereum hirsutum FP-91666 SS1]EIM90427.1 hypothetical protein STEHIDRAFT_145507 [Stereum hirsutum FP-91666 SS1]
MSPTKLPTGRVLLSEIKQNPATREWYSYHRHDMISPADDPTFVGCVVLPRPYVCESSTEEVAQWVRNFPSVNGRAKREWNNERWCIWLLRTLDQPRPAGQDQGSSGDSNGQVVLDDGMGVGAMGERELYDRVYDAARAFGGAGRCIFYAGGKGIPFSILSTE